MYGEDNKFMKYIVKMKRSTVIHDEIFNSHYNWKYKRRNKIHHMYVRLVGHLLLIFGQILGHFLDLVQNNKLIIFFPFYHIGGAEKIHAQIVHCLKDQKPLVVFLQKSKNSKFFHQFQDADRIIDFKKIQYINFFYTYFLIFIILGIFIENLNRREDIVILGGNCLPFYVMLPYLQERIIKVDLIHAFGGGIEYKSLPYVEFLDRRIVINRKTYEDFEVQYNQFGLNPALTTRIKIIANGIPIPQIPTYNERHSTLHVLYVGRGTEEKRVHLIGKIACKCDKLNIPVKFTLIGDVKKAVPEVYHKYLSFLGEVSDSKQLNSLYGESDLLLITSRYEGFPVAIMEAMVFGVIPISTDVGGIGEHIKPGVNGYLVKNGSEDEIVTQFVEYVQHFSKNREHLLKMSIEAQSYALRHFDLKRFCEEYRAIFSKVQSL